MRIGYARCSTEQQDLTAQVQQLMAMGIDADRIYTDHGRTGANADRPGLRQALAATRGGDVFVVTKLDRLARSVPDARALLSQLTDLGATVQVGHATYDPAEPTSMLFINMLAAVAEFERGLISQRTREGLAVARQKGRLRGGQTRWPLSVERHMVHLREVEDHSVAEVCKMYQISPSTYHRARLRVLAADTGVSREKTRASRSTPEESTAQRNPGTPSSSDYTEDDSARRERMT